MIGKLKGRIDSSFDDSLIIDVGGVGYHVFCATRVIAALQPGTSAELIIETHVREDHIHLYGFVSVSERDWFRLLCSVQGVGNKTALAILSTYTPDALSRAILAKDIAAFKAISGIGPKLAERIVTELKDKALKMGIEDSGLGINLLSPKAQSLRPKASHQDDAISALVNLGYSRSEAYGAVMAHASTTSLDALIKLALKELMKP